MEWEIDLFIYYHNYNWDHESLNNVTPTDVYYAKHRKVYELRDMMKGLTLEHRRRKNLGLRPMREDAIRPETIRESIS